MVEATDPSSTRRSELGAAGGSGAAAQRGAVVGIGTHSFRLGDYGNTMGIYGMIRDNYGNPSNQRYYGNTMG